MEERGVEKWDLGQEPKDALLQVEGHRWLDVGKGPCRTGFHGDRA